MIIDSQLLLTGTQAAPSQAITATANSTNVYDWGAYPGTVTNGSYDVGEGTPLEVSATVTQTFNNLTSLTVSLVSSASASLTSPTIEDTVTVPLAGLTAGATINLGPPTGSITQGRYMGLIFTVTGTAPTQGAIEAALVLTRQANNAANLPTLQTA